MGGSVVPKRSQVSRSGFSGVGHRGGRVREDHFSTYEYRRCGCRCSRDVGLIQADGLDASSGCHIFHGGGCFTLGLRTINPAVFSFVLPSFTFDIIQSLKISVRQDQIHKSFQEPEHGGN